MPYSCFTGCRISEALALTYGRIDLSSKEVVILSLKKRKKLSAKPQYRAIPVPDYFIDALSLAHGLRERKKCDKDLKLWTWTRQHAARLIKAVMQDAGIDTALPHANPKGLRHTFGIHAVLSDVPVTEIQLLMGHSDLKTTALYLESFGKEKRTIVAKMW